jgi:hypothetical protein
MDLNEVFEKLEPDLQMFVAEFARRRVFVRADVVGWRGRAIAIVGTSGSGKSTLMSELVSAGATYYSDLYAVLDKRGRVHPFPKPVAIREKPLESPSVSPGFRPLPLGLVVMSHYVPGAKWRPRQLSMGHGVLALLKNTVPARRQPEASLDALKKALSEAPVISSKRGEAKEVVEFILSFVEEGIAFRTERERLGVASKSRRHALSAIG